MDNVYVWVGIRETDVLFTKSIFQGSITIFGSNKDGNIAMERIINKRPDYNSSVSGYVEFLENNIIEVLKNDPSIQFLLYSPIDGYYLSEKIQKSLACQNPIDLLSILNNKLYSKLWLSRNVSILPIVALVGAECSLSGIKKLIPGSNDYIVQSSYSSGGHNTFLLNSNSENQVMDKIQPHLMYNVTPYQRHSIPINIHTVIYKQDIIYFPPSIQLIDTDSNTMQYRGADFTAYQLLSDLQKDIVLNTAKVVASKLQQLGYKGVCGIDLLLVDNVAYFMEINPRFQASSFLLNKNLNDSGLNSIQAYHIDSFNNASCTLVKPKEYAKGSTYSYCYSKNKTSQLKWLHNMFSSKSFLDIIFLDDELDWSVSLEEDTYLFKIVFDSNISFTDEENIVRIHPNIILGDEEPDLNTNLIKLKIMLMNHGIQVSDNAEKFLNFRGGIEYQEFNAIDIRLDNKNWVSTPYKTKFSRISSFSIEFSDSESLQLTYYGNILFPIIIKGRDEISEKVTQKGHKFSEIAYLGIDRLRISYRNKCCFQELNKSCMFCNLQGNNTPFCFEEICEVIDVYDENDTIKHFMIGGGSDYIQSNYFDVIRIADYIQKKNKKPIYLMTLPINNENTLYSLKKAGVTEVAFNIEMFNREYAKRIMPGKGAISLEYYYESLQKAIKVWPDPGAVRSIVILGLDSQNDFVKGIKRICSLGVTPILSIFKPLTGTTMENQIPLSDRNILQMYFIAQSICTDFGLKLGPHCPGCQNNTVAISTIT